MSRQILDREPLTEQEVIELLDQDVKDTARRWGENDFYTKMAREYRAKRLEAFRNGEVIPVKSVGYVDKYGNGCGDYEDVLYSDGHVETACYGYLD